MNSSSTTCSTAASTARSTSTPTASRSPSCCSTCDIPQTCCRSSPARRGHADPIHPRGDIDETSTRRPRRRCARSAAAVASPRTIPNKPITFVVPFAAGSATDQLARALGQRVTDADEAAIVVDNKPGASRLPRRAAGGQGARRRLHRAHHHQHHARRQRAPLQDAALRPGQGLRAGDAARQGRADHDREPKVEAKTVGEFIALAKKKPGKLTFGSGSSSPRSPASCCSRWRHPGAARAVQEQPARDHRSARRPDRHDDHRHRHRHPAGEGRQGARARRHEPASARRSRPTCRPSTRRA